MPKKISLIASMVLLEWSFKSERDRYIKILPEFCFIKSEFFKQNKNDVMNIRAILVIELFPQLLRRYYLKKE